MVLTSQSSHSESSKKEMEKLKDLPTPKDQEDLDQRELLTLEKLSFLEKPMMSESTLLEDRSEKRMVRLSTKPPISKDSSPKRELEERSSTREPELTHGKPTKRLTSLTRNSSQNISRRRKLPRKPPSQLQSQQKLPQLKPLQLKPLQPKPLQPKLPQQPRRKLERKTKRSE